MSGELLAALTLEQKLAFTETLLHKATRWIEIIAARIADIEHHPRYDETEWLKETLRGFKSLADSAVEDCGEKATGPRPGELWR